MRISDWSSDVCSSDLDRCNRKDKRGTLFWHICDKAVPVPCVNCAGSLQSVPGQYWHCRLYSLTTNVVYCSIRLYSILKSPGLSFLWINTYFFPSAIPTGDFSTNASGTIERSEDHTSELQSLMR